LTIKKYWVILKLAYANNKISKDIEGVFKNLKIKREIT